MLCSDRAPSRPPACSAARRLGAAVGLAVLTGCSAVGSPPAPAPSGAPGMLPAGHVHGVGIDPGDGALLLATHHGLLEVDDEGSLSAVGPEIDLMGFAVAGPDHYLASGHPGLTVDLPQPVGLIETTDGGRTWAPVSRQGQSDFHALTLLPDGGVLGYDGLLRRAADGTSWEQLAIPTEPYTLAASPDGTQVLATTPAGPLRSTDAGGSWAPVPNAPLLQVAAWSDVGGTAVGIGPRGEVWISTDFADTWERKGHLGAAPHAVAATTAGGGLRILAVTEQGVWESTDGGRTFTTVLTP